MIWLVLAVFALVALGAGIEVYERRIERDDDERRARHARLMREVRRHD